MEENHTVDIPQMSPEECDILTTKFTKEEVKEAIMQMKRNKASGPDGFPAELYEIFWDVIKADFMAMFVRLQTGELPLFKLIKMVFVKPY
jgi:hypothetical protein